jgi:hypothetical protein
VKPLLSLDDDSREARSCKEQYPKIRDEVLTSHPWNFAIKRVKLAQTTYVPAFEYELSYALPTDLLRIVRTDLNLAGSFPERKWATEINPDTNSRVLVTSSDEVNIEYIFRQENVTTYTATFIEALATRLAADLAYDLLQSTTVQAQMFQIYNALLRDARTFDAQEKHREEVEAYDWLNSRF